MDNQNNQDNVIVLENEDERNTIQVDPIKYSNSDFANLANPKRNNNNSDTEQNGGGFNNIETS